MKYIYLWSWKKSQHRTPLFLIQVFFFFCSHDFKRRWCLIYPPTSTSQNTFFNSDSSPPHTNTLPPTHKAQAQVSVCEVGSFERASSPGAAHTSSQQRAVSHKAFQNATSLAALQSVRHDVPVEFKSPQTQRGLCSDTYKVSYRTSVKAEAEMQKWKLTYQKTFLIALCLWDLRFPFNFLTLLRMKWMHRP